MTERTRGSCLLSEIGSSFLGENMFFDTQRKDETYLCLLMDAAQKQRELFLLHYDWSERKVGQEETRKSGFGFFKRKAPSDSRYQQALLELEEIKRQIKKHRDSQGYRNGVFWWNVPWDIAERWLQYDLSFDPGEGNWRFENQVKAAGKDGIYLLYMHEEGHLSDFSSSSSHTYSIQSEYTDAQRNEMVQKYNRDLNFAAMMDLSYEVNRPVHSTLSGADYDSKADYYMSGEYFALRSYLSDSYDRKLYTEVESYGVTAVSNSKHYECLFGLADYHVDGDGTLDHVTLKPFPVFGSRGDLPYGLNEKYARRDPAVLCAGYFADDRSIQSVPIELFGKNPVQSAVSFEEAMRQTEIFTCLAGKMQI